MRLREAVLWLVFGSIAAVAMGTAVTKMLSGRYEAVLQELKGGKP